MVGTFLEWYLENLNYWSIFLLMTIESSFIPFPSEVVVPPAAYLAAQGELSGFGVIFASTIGSLAGAIINYVLAYYLGRPLVYAFARSRVGRILLLSEEKVQKSEAYFYKKGVISTFLGRLVPGIRQLISIPAGLVRMPMGPFLLYTALGAGIWICVLFGLGWWASDLPGIDTTDKLIALSKHYSDIIGYSILALIVIAIAVSLIRKKMKKSRSQQTL